MKKYLHFFGSILFSFAVHATDVDVTNAPVRLGLVGLGNHMTEKLIPSLDQEKFQLVGGCRRNLSELAKQKDKYCFSFITADYKEMISQNEIDAILVSGTPELHREVVKASLEHGIHVFVEKPVSLSLDDVQFLAHLAAEKNKVVSVVGFNLTYIPSITTVKQKLMENELENLVTRSSLGNPLNQQETLAQTLETSLYFAFIHSVSFVMDVMGYPKDIHVDFKKGTHHQGFSWEVVTTHDHDRKSRMHFANCIPGGFNFNVAYDDKQGAHVINATQKSGVSGNEKQLSYKNELDAFYESIKTGQSHRNNLQRNLEVHEVLEKIKEMVYEQAFHS